jgi:UDP-glucose 6-dehydrogenase
VKQGLVADLGSAHRMDVFDSGYRGFDGKCLPKDMQGLIDAADDGSAASASENRPGNQ